MRLYGNTLTLRISAACALAFLAATATSAPTMAQSRVYTNADLSSLAPPENAPATTGGKSAGTAAKANWKEPLPTQSAPVATGATPSWESIMAFIDRERAYEERRKDRELQMAQLALAASQAQEMNQYQYARGYYYPGFPFFSVGTVAPFSQPSNPYATLRARNIGNAVQLNNESVINSAIRRADINRP